MKMIKNSAFLPGLLFLLFNATTSYSFYHVNSYKMVVLSLCVIFLFFADDLLGDRRSFRLDSWKIGTILSVPTLFSLPGYFIRGGIYNYNFPYELSIDLMMILWGVYLFRRLESEKEIRFFFSLVGITSIYLVFISLLEYNRIPVPFAGAVSLLKDERVKATFGNPNYFSAAIAVLFPSVFILTLSWLFPILKKTTKMNPRGFIYLASLFSFLVCIYLTETRSAQAGLLLGSFTGLFLFLIHDFPKWKKTILSAAFSLVFLGIVFLVWVKVNEPEWVINSRYGPLFYLSGWINRFKAWEAALNSIASAPIFGYGLGSSYSLYFQFVNVNSQLYSYERSFNHVHSEYLETAQEAGILGALVIYAVVGWILYKLYHVIKNREISTFDRHLAIGLFSGIIAYNIHGTFSVAQRMVVAILPYFSVLAISLKLIHKNGLLKIGFLNYWERVPPKILRFGISGVLVIGLIVAYAPWAYKQKSFVDLNNGKYFSVGEYLDAARDYAGKNLPDIYALDLFLSKALEAGNLNFAEKLIPKIRGLIPHYRNLDFKDAYISYSKREYALAQKKAFDYLKTVNRYDLSGQSLLFASMVQTKDFSLFPELLEWGFRYSLVNNFAKDQEIDLFRLEVAQENISISEKREGSIITVKIPKDQIERIEYALVEIKKRSTLLQENAAEEMEKFVQTFAQLPMMSLEKNSENLDPEKLNYIKHLIMQDTKIRIIRSFLNRYSKKPQVKKKLDKLTKNQKIINNGLEELGTPELRNLISFNARMIGWLARLAS